MSELKKKVKVGFNINEKMYIEYKKILLDLRTTPTSDFIKYIQKVNDGYELENITLDKSSMSDKIKVAFNINEDIYIRYKKILLDRRTTPTIDLNKYVKSVIDTL